MRTTIDGNEAAASVAYRLNEVCCIYPITPSSPMAELADEWAGQGRTNVWGSVPSVVEMQSEGGAAGALHGSLQGGALTTTFTASQGLLLMIPNMYKIAGELTPCVFHVAARSLAAQALSIFGDHSDVMAVRQTGFALLVSASVQEAHDLAVVAQVATLRTRVPFVHFFDGFRTSHELNTVELLTDEDLLALVPADLVRAHRGRALSPERPFIRGTAQNPDVYFQARETVNPFYARVPSAVQEAMDALAERTGRRYSLAEYHGAPDAERVIVAMGSGAQTAAETAAHLAAQGERVGVVQLRLYRPFPAAELLAVIPASARRVAVLDRTKEPGGFGEPLFLDVLGALAEAQSAGSREIMPLVIGGRYGLSSKELTPAMVAGIFAELGAERPRTRFTIGINDDVSGTSLSYDRTLDIESSRTLRAVFFGMGSDGTVGANKNTIKIIGEDPGRHAQGYFVYDSKKSGSETVSHLRFGPDPIRAPYLIDQAGFVGCHHPRLIERPEVLGRAAPGATFLLNTPVPAGEVWDSLPREAQEQLLAKRITLYTIDAGRVAREAGLAGRVNTVLQTCFFAISGVLPQEQAIAEIKHAITKSYARRGPKVIAQNEAAVDAAVASLHRVELPARVTATRGVRPAVPDDAPAFVRNVIGAMMAGHGEDLPVSALPVDGTYPSGTAAYEKRNISDEVAVWDQDLCIQCGNCSFVCPHSVIRSKLYDAAELAGAPEGYASMPLNARGLPDARFTLMVYLEDCTGCALCVEACPVSAPADPKHKAINLAAREPRVAAERRNIEFFESLPVADRSRVDFGTVRGTQYLQPLFEFSGACAGCGETPYLKLLSQLFGDRLMVANATGCSSIYGGNLPTTPWTSDASGRGPAWSNSLFEDNAEFGLGFRLAADQQLGVARERLGELRETVGAELVDAILAAPQRRETEYSAQRERVDELRRRLDALGDDAGPVVTDLRSVMDQLVRRSVWIVGGDGWAYDIGAGGLDHVLGSGRDVNVLVLDTEVYSNTGGQASKSTPLGAVAKFASAGKRVGKKDLALQAIAYGNVYVARVAMGADPEQTLRALREAEAYEGPSLVIAYSHCIAHGIEKDGVLLRNGMDQQYRAVASGAWPLVRYDPLVRGGGGNPFLLDSPRPRMALTEYTGRELRYRSLARTHPAEAERLAELAQEEVDRRWATYEEMASHGADRFPGPGTDDPARPGAEEGDEVNLETTYLGLALTSPLVASAGPLTRSVAGIRRLAAAGVGAVVLPSLFEEQIRREAERDAALAEAGSDSFGEALSYLPAPRGDGEPRQYLNVIERASAAVKIPVIASLNGATTGGWTAYASSMQSAGAAALELNIYYLNGDPLSRARDVEERYVEVLSAVRAAVTIPIAVKLAPFFSSLGEMATHLQRAGADGLVLFNRFMQSDIDPDTLTVTAGLTLSNPAEGVLPRSWIARLRGIVPLSLAASTGVESAHDVAAYLLAGADVVMSTSSLLRHGPEHAVALLDGLQAWMARKGFVSLDQVRGRLSLGSGADPAAYGRSSYLTTIDEATQSYAPG